MAFHPLKNPPQWMLDNLLKEDFREVCPDCQAKVGERHSAVCDVARCVKTRQQRESCGCGECGLDKWDGHWPYVQAAYDAKLVVYDDICGDVGFDLNTVAAQQIGARSGK